MNKNQVIIDIAKYHVEWIRYVIRNALSISQRRNAEDFVQAAYLKLLKQDTFDPIKYYAADDKINKKYFFRTLKSLMIDENKKKKIKTISITSNMDVVDEIINKPHMEVVYKKLEKTMNNMYWYDKKMLNLYVYHIPSIRKISTETTISSKAVFKTLKRCKLTIKKEVAKVYYYGKAV
tara:strand:- start:796 stop:1329 length:534 start_codon:yes stop_codon:yes gene_type:complete